MKSWRIVSSLLYSNTYRCVTRCERVRRRLCESTFAWMNEWMTVYPYPHRYVWTHRERATLKRNVFNEIYSGFYLNVSINMFSESLDNWRISLIFLRGITIIKRLDPKIVLLHKAWDLWTRHLPSLQCPPGQGILSVHVMHPINSPELCIERRNLASHSSALTTGLVGPTIGW